MLDQLMTLLASPHSKTVGILWFLTEEGIAQTVINLLPFFQYLAIKCKERRVVIVLHRGGFRSGQMGIGKDLRTVHRIQRKQRQGCFRVTVFPGE